MSISLANMNIDKTLLNLSVSLVNMIMDKISVDYVFSLKFFSLSPSF